MNGFPTREQVERIKAWYPAGTRIRLNSMDDPYAPISPGTEGVVDHVDDIGTLHCKFENGRGLGVIVGEDSFSVIEPEEEQKHESDHEIGKRQDVYTSWYYCRVDITKFALIHITDILLHIKQGTVVLQMFDCYMMHYVRVV